MSLPHLPRSLQRLLDAFRPCFTPATFTTFITLVIGVIAAPAQRTVCGMLTAARVAGVWHHSRAHRFFATSHWSRDHLGLTMVRGLVVGWLTPAGAPLLVAVDDTLFRRTGRKVHGAFWAYDGSRKVAAGQEKLSRGTTFVIAGLVVKPPFLERPVALPVLFRLRHPGGPTKPALAKELITLIAGARPDRQVHVVGDGAYLCTTLRHLPVNATLTGPLPRHAALWEVRSLTHGRRRTPGPRSLVHHENTSQLPGHAGQAPARAHRGAISWRPGRWPHPGTNPGDPVGLGRRRSLTAKGKRASAHA